MRIIADELKKVFCDRVCIILLLALALANILITYFGDSINTYYSPAAYKSLYSDIKFMPLKDAVDELEEKAKVLSRFDEIPAEGMLEYTDSVKAEEALYNDVLKQIKIPIEYKNYLDSVQNKADTMGNISIFQNNTSKFGKRNILKTAADFKNLYTVANNISVTPAKWVEMSVNCPFTDVLSLILILLLCFQIMIREKQDSSIYLMKSTSNGRLLFISAKIFAVIIGSVCISISLYSSNIIIASAKYGLGDMSCAVQSIPEFENCCYKFTVSDFLLYYVIFKIMIFAFFAVFTLLLSYVSNYSSSIYLTLSVLEGVSAALYFIIPSNHALNFFKYINIYYFQQAGLVLGKYQNVNVFGHPCGNTVCFLVVTSFLILVFISANILIFCKLHIIQKETAIFKIKHKDRKTITNLLQHELYKSAITSRALFIIIIFFILQVILALSHTEPLYYDDINYRTFVGKVGGNVTEKNQYKIDALRSHFEMAEEELRSITEKEMNEKISQAEYSSESMRLTNELNKKSALENLEERYHQLLEMKNQTGKQCSLIFEKEYDLLTNSPTHDTVNLLKLSIILIACFCGYFSIEETSGMNRIIRTCFAGEKTVRLNKIFCAVIASATAFLITYLPDILLTWHNYGFNDLNAPLCSLKQFTFVHYNMPIWVYLLYLYIARFIYSQIAMLTIYYISCRCKRPLISISVSSAVLVLPLLIKLLV